MHQIVTNKLTFYKIKQYREREREPYYVIFYKMKQIVKYILLMFLPYYSFPKNN